MAAKQTNSELRKAKGAEIQAVSELVPRWVQEVKESYEQDD